MDKNFKIWGVSYGLIGDLIMGLPVLTYFEKKYPGSYKFWGIEKKCAFTAPLFLNHPLIDKILISSEWNTFGPEDYTIINSCNIKTTIQGWRHDPGDWYNYRGQVEETARLAGIMDLFEVLTPEERKPKLYKWFDIGLVNSAADTSSKYYQDTLTDYSNVVAIWPFSTSSKEIPGIRAPSEEWWNKMIKVLTDNGLIVFHFGRLAEPILSESSLYKNYTYLCFFDQIRLALATKIAIATDSGPSWVLNAYSHSCITLLTNWLSGHQQNFEALAPVGDNSITVFEKHKCDNINQDTVLQIIKRKI